MEEKNTCKDCCKEISEDTSKLYKGYCKSCYNERYNNSSNSYSKKQQDLETEKFKFGFILVIIIVIAFLCFFFSLGSNSNNTSTSSDKPTDIELMSYAQTILQDNLNNPTYSHYKGDYTFINTNLRYKIEGNVTLNNSKEKFYMIIEFLDKTYKEYDLISLQVGNDTIYKK